MSHSGPRTADGDHWDNDIITAILILLGHTIIIRHPLRARSCWIHAVLRAYISWRVLARAVAFCRAVTKYDDPGADVPVDEIVRTPAPDRGRGLTLISTRGPVPEPNARLLHARWSNLRAAHSRRNDLHSAAAAVDRVRSFGTSVID